MPTNDPLDARLAAVQDRIAEAIACNRRGASETGYPYVLSDRIYDLERIANDVSALTALLAADPPGATVEVLCWCGCPESPMHTGWYTTGRSSCRECNECTAFTPTTARVSYTRALTEEERTR